VDTPLEERRAATRTGLTLAALVFGSWLLMHVGTVLYYPLTPLGLALLPLPLAALCWLDVGLFILAHDCMHGTLAPTVPWLHRPLGRLLVTLYAGFGFDGMEEKHHLHHHAPGTADDPDFHDAPRCRFWPWYLSFVGRYATLRQGLTITVLFWPIVLWGGVPAERLLLFWALPGVLSSLQLFYFGTYLPHVPRPAPFADRHHARSNAYGEWVSLLTCFHFGYHHEHHLYPHRAWWELPRMRRARANSRELHEARG
jgi:beta-carotene/zeaxanthin 4-ketolase